MKRVVEFLNRAANELNARRHPAQGEDTLALEARRLIEELGYVNAPHPQDLPTQQQLVVEAVQLWQRHVDENDQSRRTMECLMEACRVIRQFPMATAYLLSIWYQPDAPEEDGA